MNYKLRKKSRETVYKLIYEMLFSDYSANLESLANMIKENKLEEDEEYIRIVYFGVIEKHQELIDIIAKFAIGFKIDRIYKTDFAALLLSIYEMKYVNNIPLNVSIAEAIELVKVYSTEKSSSYVNGILSSVYKDLSCNDRK